MNIFNAMGRVLDSVSNALVTTCDALDETAGMLKDAAKAGRVQTTFLVDISEQDVKERRIKFKAGLAEAKAEVQAAEKKLNNPLFSETENKETE